MSAESSYSYTLKTPKAGNLFTVRGDTAEEAKANLDAAVSSGLLTTISQIEASLRGETPASAAAPAAATAVSAATAAQSAQELPAEFAVKCKECGGATRFVQEGISQKSGLPYRRYACTASQLHKSTFA